jgi:CMP-N-acetylneuraminic acid synthetase
MKPDPIGIILARQNSKGIKNKNIKPICGNPLIFYVINASLKAGLKTYVSSDGDDILKFSEKCGAIPFKRNSKYATDTSPSTDALLEFCYTLDQNHPVALIQPTSPLMESKHLLEGLDLLESFDSVFSAYKQHWLPTWDENANPVGWDNSVNKKPRRQDRPAVYIENGAFVISRADNIKKSKLQYSGNIGIYEMSVQDSFQIDDLQDWKLVEQLLNGKIKQSM